MGHNTHQGERGEEEVPSKDVFCDRTKKVCRTLFCSIVSRLTKGDIKQSACVDYKLHALAYENVSTLRRIIEDQVREPEDRRKFKKLLNAVRECLKYSYFTHIRCNDEDPYHNTKFSLKHGTFDEPMKKSNCRDCNIAFKYLAELRSKIIDRTEQVEKIISGAGTKF